MNGRTPSQTIGPFFHEALRWPDGGKIPFAESGQKIVLRGRITDGANDPVSDAMIEYWQLAPGGRSPAAIPGAARPSGFGRVLSAEDGSYEIETLLPTGYTDTDGATIAPHIDVTFFARGLLKALRTRVFIADEASVRNDPIAKALNDPARLKTLLATPERGRPNNYRWDVRFQGADETVFFLI